MKNLEDPEVLAAAVGLALVCVFLGVTIRLLLKLELYIPVAAIMGAVVGVLVYFDRQRRGVV